VGRFDRHFSASTIRALRKAGVRILSLQALPDATGSFLNSTTGYVVDDNGTGRVLTFREVLDRAGRA
jgi:hypothetical protein